MTIDVFIFNYAHYFDAKLLYDSFNSLGYKTYILNCESPTDPPFKATDTIIKLPNIYYSGQWNEALNRATGDVLFLINSDVKISQLKKVMYRLNQFYNHYGDEAGIYAPNHYWTPWTYNPDLCPTVKFNLKKVPATDSTIWSLRRVVAEEVGQIDLKVNSLGWGIEIVAAYLCYKKNRLVVRDYNVFCNHPHSTAYNRGAADMQWRNWIGKLGFNYDFWNYYHSRGRYGFGWRGHYEPPATELKHL